jgi:hypothetical protein
MDLNVLACVVGATVILVLGMGLLNLVESRRTRRMVETLIGVVPGGCEGLVSTMSYQREPVIIGSKDGRSESRPLGSTRPPSTRPPSTHPPSTHPPSAAPAAGASAAPEPAARGERGLVRPPPIPREEPELRAGGAVETERKPGAAPSSRQRPAVTAESDRAALVRALDASDEAQADQAPATSHPASARPPSSGAHVAGSPPVSGRVVAVDPSLAAAGFARPQSVERVSRSERPPHAPPAPIGKRPTLLGGIGAAPVEQPRSTPSRPAADFDGRRGASAAPAAGAPPPTQARAPSPPVTSDTPVPAALLSAATAGLGDDDEATFRHAGALPFAEVRPEDFDTDFDDDNEATKVAPRPKAEALAPKPSIRATYATLPSMPSVVPSSTRPVPTVETVPAPVSAGAGDEPRGTPPPGSTG